MTSTFLGPEYGRQTDGGFVWNPDADTTWWNQHQSFDPYGGFNGPLGAPPHGSALHAQAAHDRAVWDAKNRLGQSASNWLQGSAGLLQSYRPGGGATMEAGIYNQLANVDLQRSQMLQPLDLMGDYRRHSSVEASRAGRQNGLIGSVLQGVGAVASLIPGVGPMVGMPLMAAGAGFQGQAAQQRASAGGGGGGGQQQGGGIGGLGPLGMLAQSGMAMTQGGGGGFATPGEAPRAMPGGGSGAPTGTPGGPGAAPASPGVPGQGGAAGGAAPAMLTPGPGSGANVAEGAGMQQGGMGGIGAPVGSMDGDFRPTRYAMHGLGASMAPQVMQAAMSTHMAVMLQQDRFLPAYSAAVDRELMRRLA